MTMDNWMVGSCAYDRVHSTSLSGFGFLTSKTWSYWQGPWGPGVALSYTANSEAISSQLFRKS